MSDYETDTEGHEDALTGNQVVDKACGIEEMSPQELSG